jgi:alpha-N-arabinofuranosidase
MYKPFQDATDLPIDLKTGTYSYGGLSVPQVSASAARSKDGAIIIGLANLDPHNPAPISAVLAGGAGSKITAEVLTAGAMDAHNSFDKPDAVHPVVFSGVVLASGKLTATLPPMSVAVITIR